jgi:hypothetical protein
MSKYFITYLIGILMLATFLGCRHEPILPEPGPCDDGYELNYVFRRGGDTNIKGLILTVTTYNSRVDSSYQVMQGYADSIEVPSATMYIREVIKQPFYFERAFNCFYAGSTKFMKVDVRLTHPDSAPDVVRRMEFILSDTNWVKMFEPEDFTETFVWPEDTNRYIKITDYWIN